MPAKKSTAKRTQQALVKTKPDIVNYDRLLADTVSLLESARQASSRAINSIMTATYWEIGRRIVELEQRGEQRAEYGQQLGARSAEDLTARFGRGFGWRNLFQMRAFYLTYQNILQTLSAKSDLLDLARQFSLSWSQYVALLGVKKAEAREFYETEAQRGGWSIRQLRRQINSQFYERTLLSRNKAKMLTAGAKVKPEDAVTPEEEIKDPYVLEFLDLKDEYSESTLEEALIEHLQTFLLELGDDFMFVGQQRRLRIDDQWFRADLVFFHFHHQNSFVTLEL